MKSIMPPKQPDYRVRPLLANSEGLVSTVAMHGQTSASSLDLQHQHTAQQSVAASRIFDAARVCIIRMAATGHHAIRGLEHLNA